MHATINIYAWTILHINTAIPLKFPLIIYAWPILIYVLQESNEVQLGKQSYQMVNELLVPQGATQSYAKLMQQMTVMSHLQSDNMAIPISSFTSFLTAGINAEVCAIIEMNIIAFECS